MALILTYRRTPITQNATQTKEFTDITKLVRFLKSGNLSVISIVEGNTIHLAMYRGEFQITEPTPYSGMLVKNALEWGAYSLDGIKVTCSRVIQKEYNK